MQYTLPLTAPPAGRLALYAGFDRFAFVRPVADAIVPLATFLVWGKHLQTPIDSALAAVLLANPAHTIHVLLSEMGHVEWVREELDEAVSAISGFIDPPEIKFHRIDRPIGSERDLLDLAPLEMLQ